MIQLSLHQRLWSKPPVACLDIDYKSQAFSELFKQVKLPSNDQRTRFQVNRRHVGDIPRTSPALRPRCCQSRLAVDTLSHPSQDVAGNNKVSVLNCKPPTTQWVTNAF